MTRIFATGQSAWCVCTHYIEDHGIKKFVGPGGRLCNSCACESCTVDGCICNLFTPYKVKGEFKEIINDVADFN